MWVEVRQGRDAIAGKKGKRKRKGRGVVVVNVLFLLLQDAFLSNDEGSKGKKWGQVDSQMLVPWGCVSDRTAKKHYQPSVVSFLALFVNSFFSQKWRMVAEGKPVHRGRNSIRGILSFLFRSVYWSLCVWYVGRGCVGWVGNTVYPLLSVFSDHNGKGRNEGVREAEKERMESRSKSIRAQKISAANGGLLEWLCIGSQSALALIGPRAGALSSKRLIILINYGLPLLTPTHTYIQHIGRHTHLSSIQSNHAN